MTKLLPFGLLGIAVLFALLLLGQGQVPAANVDADTSLPLGTQAAGALPKEIDNSIGMKLVLIPAGTFAMGSPAAEKGRGIGEVQHDVQIGQAFYMGKFEVTQAQYTKATGKNPSWFCNDGLGKESVKGIDTSDFPVEYIVWNDAMNFCRRLTAMEKDQKRTYDLPTEAEWEYACRAGTKTPFSFGDSLSAAQANFDGRVPFGGAAAGPFLNRTVKVGSYQPNAWGLYDMHGNVFEWCKDWFGGEYFKSSPERDPQGPQKGDLRVMRGGSFLYPAANCRSAYRNSHVAINRMHMLGFRVVVRLAS